MKSSDIPESSSCDPRDLARADFLRIGNIGTLHRGQEVWVERGEFWEEAVITSRLPGNVYRARFKYFPGKAFRVIVSCQNFGGLIEDAK